MAIDTAEKRRSVSGIPFLPLGPGVTPELAKDAEWRQQVGWSYSGIPAATVSVAATWTHQTATARITGTQTSAGSFGQTSAGRFGNAQTATGDG